MPFEGYKYLKNQFYGVFPPRLFFRCNLAREEQRRLYSVHAAFLAKEWELQRQEEELGLCHNDSPHPYPFISDPSPTRSCTTDATSDDDPDPLR